MQIARALPQRWRAALISLSIEAQVSAYVCSKLGSTQLVVDCRWSACRTVPAVSLVRHHRSLLISNIKTHGFGFIYCHCDSHVYGDKLQTYWNVSPPV